MMTRHHALFWLVLGALALPPITTFAEGTDEGTAADEKLDRRIRVLAYNPNTIYPVSTRVGYQTYIEFSPHEEVQTISIGERSYWQLIPADNRLFIRPLRPDVATNMTIITTQRAYQFDLSSVADPSLEEESAPEEPGSEKVTKPRAKHHTPPSDVAYVIRFSYPSAATKHISMQPMAPRPQPGPMAAAIPPAPPPTPESPFMPNAAPAQTIPVPLIPSAAQKADPIRPESNRNYLYTYSGPDSEAPYEIFDDGQTTFFRYTDSSRPAPQVASIGTGGRETPLSVFRKDSYFAVNTVTPTLMLIANGSKVFVYNESLPPAGNDTQGPSHD